MLLRLCVFVLVGLLALLSPLQARPLYIVAIGASNTSGLGVGEQNAYPAVLERASPPEGRRCPCYKRGLSNTSNRLGITEGQ
jgi:hypothetical protein